MSNTFIFVFFSSDFFLHTIALCVDRHHAIKRHFVVISYKIWMFSKSLDFFLVSQNTCDRKPARRTFLSRHDNWRTDVYLYTRVSVTLFFYGPLSCLFSLLLSPTSFSILASNFLMEIGRCCVTLYGYAVIWRMTKQLIDLYLFSSHSGV